MKHQLIILLSLIFLFSSCSTVRMNLGGIPDKRPIVETKTFFILGLVGEHNFVMKEYCRKGPSKIKEQFTPADVLLTIITFGIYAPRTVTIHCRI